MRKLKYIFLFAIALACVPAAHAQNFTTVSSSNIKDVGGNPLSSGLLCFVGTDASNNPISFQVGSGGQTLAIPFCTPIANGAIGTFQVPNPATTNPLIYYDVKVLPRPQRPGNVALLEYKLVAFSGSTFNFDLYAPPGGTIVAQVGSSITGPFTVNGNQTITGSLTVGSCTGCGSSGGSGPTIETNGTNNTLQTSLNFQNAGPFVWSNPSAGNEQVNVAAQAQNSVYAGPSSGGGGAPSFRALVATDIPAIAVPLSSVTAAAAPTGVFDFSGVTQLLARVDPGLTSSANGDFGYDTTNKNWHVYQNSTDRLMAVIEGTPTNLDCAQFHDNGGSFTVEDYGSPCSIYIDVQSEGAKPDTKIVTDGAMASGGTFTLTSATAGFTSADVGKSIWLISSAGNLMLLNDGCNGSTNSPATTIATFVNSTTVTLTGEYCGSSGALTAMTVTYGTDDTAAFTNAFTASVSGNTCMTIHAGSYIVSAPWVSAIGTFQCILGAGHGLVNVYHSPAITWSTYVGSAFYNFQGEPTVAGVNLQAQSMVQGSFTNVSLLSTPGARFTDLYASGFNFPSSNVIFNFLGDDDVVSRLVTAGTGGVGLSVHSNYFECYSCILGSSNDYAVQIQDGGHQEFFGGLASSAGPVTFDVAAGSGSVAQGVIYGMVLCANNNSPAFQMEAPAGSFTSEYKIVDSYINQYSSITGCGTGPATNVTGIKVLGASGRNVLTVGGNTIGSTGTGYAISNADTLFESGVDNLNGNGAISNTGSWYSNPEILPGVNSTGLTGSIGNTTFYTTTRAGLYRADVDLLDTAAGTGGTVAASIVSNNGVGTNTQTTSSLSLTGSGELSTSFTFYSGNSQNVQYSTAVSGATGSPTYALRLRLSYLGP